MKKYCYIENNQVVLINQVLPVTWKNVSNFHKLPDSLLKIYGWLPLTVESENKAVFVSSEYIIEENQIREIVITRDKTLEETNEDLNRETEEKWVGVRDKRNQLLRDSDFLLLIDRWNTFSTEKQNEILSYRQTLRDLPQNFQNPDEIVWPNLS
jgi:hypothetical protein